MQLHRVGGVGHFGTRDYEACPLVKNEHDLIS
jgi:hypothetical protein